MTIPRGRVAAWFGCSILIWHVVLMGYLFFGFQATSRTAAPVEIALPITFAYAVGVVKWLIDTQGKVKKRPTVGFPYVFGIALIFLACVVGTIFTLHTHTLGDINGEELNARMAFIEAGLGALLVLFANDLFATKESDRATR